MCCNINLIPIRFRKWSTLLGGLLIHLSLGSMYTFGNMSPYITSYLREYVGIDIRYSNSIWIYSSTSISLCIGTVLSGLFISRFQPRLKLVILFGCFLMSASVALTYFTINTSFIPTILTYGVLNGFGTGVAYLSPLSIVMKAFPENKGFANSVILFGFGASSIIFDQVETLYVNPDNYPPDKPYSDQFPNEKYFSKLHLDLLTRIPNIFLISSGIYFLLQIIGLMLIYEEAPNPTKEDEQPNDLNEANSDQLITNSHREDVIDQIEVNSLGVKYEIPEEGLTIKQALFVKEFYLGTLLLALFTIAPSLIVSYYKTFGQTFINDDKYLAIVGSVSSIFNACGRLFWGFLIDRLPFKYCYLILNTIITALIVTVYLNTYINIKEIYLIWICAIFFLQCGIFVITPTTMAKCFGQKHFTSIYGLMYMMCIPSSFVAALLGPYSDKIGWFWLFFCGCVFSFIGWFTVLFFNVKKSNGKYI